MYERTRVSAWAAVATGIFVAACGPNEQEQAQLAQLPVVTAERERLQGEVDRLTMELSQIEEELAKAPDAAVPAEEGRDWSSAPAEIGRLVTRSGELQEQLAAAQTRLRSVNASNAAQVQRIGELEAAIEEERVALQNHQLTIASLEAAILGLETEVARQGEVNQQLEQTVANMADEANTVWYVVGTKQELLDAGVVTEEGGSRVLFIFGKRGKTLVPSRTMDPTRFQMGDLRTLDQIALPIQEGDDEPKWTVVTPQDLAAVGSPLDDRGRVLGDALSIADRERFWANGRYLIVVRS